MVSSTPRPYFTPMKDPAPILQEAGWAPGPVWTGGKFRCPDRPAPSRSLYQLSCPAHSRLLFRSFSNNFYPPAPIKNSHGKIVQAAVAYFNVLTDETFQIQNRQHLIYTGQTEGIIYTGCFRRNSKYFRSW